MPDIFRHGPIDHHVVINNKDGDTIPDSVHNGYTALQANIVDTYTAMQDNVVDTYTEITTAYIPLNITYNTSSYASGNGTGMDGDELGFFTENIRLLKAVVLGFVVIIMMLYMVKLLLKTFPKFLHLHEKPDEHDADMALYGRAE